MPVRAYWTGNIRLSLVSIPVEVVPATKSTAKISFHQVHKPSGSRIRYQKVVPGVGPVENDEIVKGYEIEKDRYVLLEDKEIEDLKLEAKKTIDLVQFVEEGAIDAVFFERPFYVLPSEDEDNEAFVVLRDAMKKTKTIGLGQIVIRGKGSIVALKPYGKGLLLETLRYADEIAKADKAFSGIKESKPDADMIELAEELIERKTKPFRADEFKDTYNDALRELIEAKAERRKVRQIETPREGAQIIDLMQALRKSVGKEGDRKSEKSEKGGKRQAKRSHSRKRVA